MDTEVLIKGENVKIDWVEIEFKHNAGKLLT